MVLVCAATAFGASILLFFTRNRSVSVFKKNIVNPALEHILEYNLNASKKFRKTAPLEWLFQNMKIDEDAFYAAILDCILGKVQTTKFAFINFQLCHGGGGRHREVFADFRGQAVLAPIRNRQYLPQDYTSDLNLKELTEGVMVQSLKEIFDTSWGPSAEKNDINSNPYAPSNNLCSQTLTSLIEKLSSKGIECKYYCVSDMFIFITKTSKTFFEYNDSTADIEEMKLQTAKEIAWARLLIEELIKTGLI